jgi:hypothetical protein
LGQSAFNIHLNSGESCCDGRGSICKGSSGVESDTNYYFVESTSSSCATENMIALESICELAASAIGDTYYGILEDANKPAGCYKLSTEISQVYFNTLLETTPGSSNGLCRARTIKYYIADQADVYCPDTDVITSAEACQAAIGEIGG